MKTVFIADMHLRPGHQPKQNKLLRDTLAAISDADRVVLLGDTFNGWFERRGRTVGDFSEVLSIFHAAAEKGLDINHVCGNRDFAVGRGLPDQWGQAYGGFLRGFRDGGVSVLAANGIKPRGMALRVKQDGMTIHCAHGDQLCLQDWGHQMLRWWIMAFPQRIGANFCPFFVFSLVIGFAQNREVFPHMGLVPYAKNISDQALVPLVDSGVDVVACGHFHRHEQREIVGQKRTGTLAICKCWSNTGIYYEFEHGRMKMIEP